MRPKWEKVYGYASTREDAWVRITVENRVTTARVWLSPVSICCHTRDPADRFLVATAQVFGLTLVTADEEILNLKQVALLAKR